MCEVGSLKLEVLCESQADGLHRVRAGDYRPCADRSLQRGLWSDPWRAEDKTLCGLAPREVCVTLTGCQESGKPSWKRGQPWSQVLRSRDGEGVGASCFSRVSNCSALPCGEQGDQLKREGRLPRWGCAQWPGGGAPPTLHLLTENRGSSQPRNSMFRGPHWVGDRSG